MDDNRFRLGDDGELYEIKQKRKRGVEEKTRLNPVVLAIGTVVLLVLGLAGGIVLDRFMFVPLPPTPVVIEPTPAATSTSLPTNAPLPPIYKTLNVNEFPTYTVYWKRPLWENAIQGTITTEDFEKDTADYGVLSFPFLTGNGFLLKGQSSAQILKDQGLLPSGNLLHFRDWKEGLTVSFPGNTAASALGFDFKTGEDWQIAFNNISVPLPKGRPSFVGIVFAKDYPHEFILSCNSNVQGGLTVDNISFIAAGAP